VKATPLNQYKLQKEGEGTISEPLAIGDRVRYRGTNTGMKQITYHGAKSLEVVAIDPPHATVTAKGWRIDHQCLISELEPIAA